MKKEIIFKPKREKLTVSATPEKPCQEKPFVQVEGELTEAQLEAIAFRLMKLTTLYTSFKEELMSRTKAREIHCQCNIRKTPPTATLFPN